jgi:thiocyanate hydrolase subunit gamma
MDEKRAQIDHNHPHVGATTVPPLGVRIVARAWADPDFCSRLLADGRTACEELGARFPDDAPLIALENTYELRHLVTCTLCNAYPKPGVAPDGCEVRVSDTTPATRYVVIPTRPVGTNGFTEDQLIALVTPDATIGVVPIAPTPKWTQ